MPHSKRWWVRLLALSLSSGLLPASYSDPTMNWQPVQGVILPLTVAMGSSSPPPHHYHPPTHPKCRRKREKMMDRWAVLQKINIKLYDGSCFRTEVFFCQPFQCCSLWGTCFFVGFWLKSLVHPIQFLQYVHGLPPQYHLLSWCWKNTLASGLQLPVRWTPDLFFSLPFALREFLFLFSSVCAVCWIYFTYPPGKELITWHLKREAPYELFYLFISKEKLSCGRPFYR